MPIQWVIGMPWPQTGATQSLAQLGLPDKIRAIKGLVVCNDWDLEPFDLLNGLALGCYQPLWGINRKGCVSVFCLAVSLSVSKDLADRLTDFLI